MKIAIKICYNYFNMGCCINYYHAKFEFQIQFVWRETKKRRQTSIWSKLHQRELFRVNWVKIFFGELNGQSELFGSKMDFSLC
jgi:hypothetical protein